MSIHCPQCRTEIPESIPLGDVAYECRCGKKLTGDDLVQLRIDALRG